MVKDFGVYLYLYPPTNHLLAQIHTHRYFYDHKLNTAQKPKLNHNVHVYNLWLITNMSGICTTEEEHLQLVLHPLAGDSGLMLKTLSFNK